MTLEWSEESQPEEGVMWRAQDGSFVAEIREYQGGYMLHVECDVFNLSEAKRQARAIFRVMALAEGEVGKAQPLNLSMLEGWHTTPNGPYEGE